jgi:hypothetical protein
MMLCSTSLDSSRGTRIHSWVLTTCRSTASGSSSR